MAHRHRLLAPALALVALLALAGCASAVSSAEVPPLTQLQGLAVQDPDGRAAAMLRRYAALPAVKAAAVALEADGRWAAAAASGAPDQFAALQVALLRCDAERTARQVVAPCEPLRIGDEEQELGLAARLRTRADDPRTPALLWRFVHGDAVLHVAGSVHAMRSTSGALPAALEQAFAAADTLMVEVDTSRVGDAERDAAARRFALQPNGRTLAQTLPPAQLAALQRLAAELGVPWAQLDTLRAGSALGVLSVRAMYTAGLDPNLGVEARLLPRAHAAGKRVLSLERFDAQVALLADAPTEAAGEDTVSEAESFAGSAAAVRAGALALLDAWQRADADAIAQLFAPPAGTAAAAWNARLLDARNAAMAQQAAETLRRGRGHVLMLVGAGHLPGPHGVLAHLTAAGFAGVQLDRGGAPYRPSPSQGPGPDPVADPGPDPAAGARVTRPQAPP